MPIVIRVIMILASLAISLTGCASENTIHSMSYLALDKPIGPILTSTIAKNTKEFRRGGFYVLNHNFRPAPDLRSYLLEALKESNVAILHDAEVKFAIPVAINLLFFGINVGSDELTYGK
jgi:hypothetical protein